MKVDKTPSEVPNKYTDFIDIFSPKLSVKLLEYIRINDQAIELVDDWQPPYGLTYSLGLIELEILKAYFKINLANSFIRPSNSSVEVSIFFYKKLNKSLRLCVDYWGFNNLIIKNWYPLSFVGKSLDWQDRAWYFTQLNLTNAYY